MTADEADEYVNMLNPNPPQLTAKERLNKYKQPNNMDTVVCKEVVITTLTRRGKGEPHSPIRAITQVFEKDGTLIAEYDPLPETFALTDLINFARWCIINGKATDKQLTPSDVYKWLDQIEEPKVDSLFGKPLVFRKQNIQQ